MIEYFIKRVLYYLLSVIIMMAVYGIITVGLSVSLNHFVQSTVLALILSGYPFYRIIRSTVKAAIEYYDGKPAYKKAERIKFKKNMFVKFLQLFTAGSIVYAFAMNDYKALKLLGVVICIVFMAVMFILIRHPATEYSKNKEKEDEQLVQRQIDTGFPLDEERLRNFMVLPSIILRTNILLVICSFVLIAVNPIPENLTIYYLLMIIKMVSGSSLLFLPVSMLFFMAQYARSRQFTIEIGKGEYGQIKIEFYKFEGHGDDRKEVRNKIDRVEQYNVGKRYIYVVRMSQFKKIKIPRTFKNEEEIIETLKIMS